MAFESCTIQLLILSLRLRSTVGVTFQFDTYLDVHNNQIKLPLDVCNHLHCAGLAVSHPWSPAEHPAFYKTDDNKNSELVQFIGDTGNFEIRFYSIKYEVLYFWKTVIELRYVRLSSRCNCSLIGSCQNLLWRHHHIKLPCKSKSDSENKHTQMHNLWSKYFSDTAAVKSDII